VPVCQSVTIFLMVEGKIGAIVVEAMGLEPTNLLTARRFWAELARERHPADLRNSPVGTA